MQLVEKGDQSDYINVLSIVDRESHTTEACVSPSPRHVSN